MIPRVARRSAGKANRASHTSIASLGAVLVLAAVLAAYGNHFSGAFHFDDAHTIENNAAIQSLENIPRFFRDATTFSSLPSNQSYRPLISTLLAIDYKLAGGLKPFWFHFSSFTFFVAVTLLFGFLVYRLLESSLSPMQRMWIALAAAAWYGLHPANADTVDYIIASADIISTLAVLGSFAVYLAFPRWRRFYFYILPAAIGILAKPPAAIFPVLFAIFLLLFREPTTEKCSGKAVLRWFAYAIPPFLVCGGLLAFVQHMTPRTWIAGASDARNYLITQPYVALLYLKTFFCPTGLSADYDLGPLNGINDPNFWIGLVFLIFITGAGIATSIFKKTRLIGFGILWFLLALLPTSLFPLAEVMNDHRTFFPYFGLVMAMAGLAALLVNRKLSCGTVVKVAVGVAIVLFLSANGYATYQRNKVWKTEESLWHDVATKSPRNARGLMNYGNELMGKRNYSAALDYFHRAQALSPRYHVLFINLAIAEDATHEPALAEQHFREALQLAPNTPDSYSYYARWLLAQGRTDEARGLLQSAVTLSPGDLTVQKLLAQSENSVDPDRKAADSYLALSLKYYREERYGESIAACHMALNLQPGYAEAWNNLGAAYNRLGRYKEGIVACKEALRQKPNFELARNNLQYARERLRDSAN